MVATKFTKPRIERMLQAAAVGCSLTTCAALAGIDQATASRWMAKGEKEFKDADPDNLTAYATFYRDFQAAQAQPRERALAIVHREMDSNPTLAWKYLERKEPGYAPPMVPGTDRPPGPVVIQLTLSDGSPLPPHSSVLDVGEVTHEPDDSAGGTEADAADADTAPTVLSLAEGGGE